MPGTAHGAIPGMPYEQERFTDEHGTNNAFQSPQTLEQDRETLTSGDTLVLQKMNTVPMPYIEESDDWENQVRKAVITRDGKNRVGGHSGELPKELYRTNETTEALEQNAANHTHGTADGVKNR